MKKPRLSVRNLSHGIRNQVILDSISFDINAGELVGVIGPNGVGKSTLLKLLTNYLTVPPGVVFVDGEDLTELTHPRRAEKIAYLSQSISESFAYRVEDLVMMGAFNQVGGIDAKKRVTKVLEELGIAHFADRIITELSGGEQQLVHFARLQMQEASILLLDEPTAALDIGHESEILDQLRRVTQSSDKCVLLAIHNLNSAAEFCDRLLVLNESKLIADGPPSLVLTAQLIEQLYGAKAVVGRHPQTGSTTVLPIRQTREQKHQKIHVIGGAGSGVLPSKWLIDLGYKVSGGIAHEKDSDTLFWQQQNIPHITVPAFAEIDDNAFERAYEKVEQADIVVLCDFPLGAGNLRNLDLANEAKELVIIRDTDVVDFKTSSKSIETIELLTKLFKKSTLLSLADFWSFFSKRAGSLNGDVLMNKNEESNL